MKFTTIIFLVVIFVSSKANAGVVISNWQERSQLTGTGKSSEILIRGQVNDIPSNQAISAFSINFSKGQDVKINRVISDNNPTYASQNADYSFDGSNLTVNFPKGKKNGDAISIYFSYDQKHSKIHPFLREEQIYVPEFAVGAKAKVILAFPGSFESATFNPNVVKQGNNFIYSGTVPENGVHEIIKITPAKSTWNVDIKSKISSDRALGKLVATVPIFFQSAHQQVENYKVLSSVNPAKERVDAGEKLLMFNTNTSQILIDATAKITTGAGSRAALNRNPDDYLSVSNEDKLLLTPILQQIKNDQSFGSIPLYAKIGLFTNKFIKYDLNYVGVLPDLKTIIKNRAGVCTEYSKLYTALARLAGIPAVSVDGIACGEYDECQGHSWNMIYFANQWLEVDPTWDLMSGIVSSSHVYVSDSGKSEIGVQYFDNGNRINASVNMKMSLEK